MKYSFVLPCAAFSVNAYRFRKGFTKTPEAKLYEAKILGLLEDHKNLIDMADEWRKNGGIFRFHINCTYPKHIFVNGSGNLSARTLDVDNVVKPLIDLVLTSFMGISDRFVIECSSSKSIGPSYTIQILLELEPQEF